MDITKRIIREALNTNDAGVAKFFGITAGAVSQWADDEPLPELRQLQFRARKPEYSPAPSKGKRAMLRGDSRM